MYSTVLKIQWSSISQLKMCRDYDNNSVNIECDCKQQRLSYYLFIFFTFWAPFVLFDENWRRRVYKHPPCAHWSGTSAGWGWCIPWHNKHRGRQPMGGEKKKRKISNLLCHQKSLKCFLQPVAQCDSCLGQQNILRCWPREHEENVAGTESCQNLLPWVLDPREHERGWRKREGERERAVGCNKCLCDDALGWLEW